MATDGRAPVSVIIPTHDRLAYLREAIASVRAQTYSSWELFVVDDGSTDATRAYVRELQQQDSRIHLIAHDRCESPARLRNAGIARAAGKYLAFLDSDDVWLAEKLEVQLEQLAHRPDCRWSYTGVVVVDAGGNELSWNRRHMEQFVPHSGRVVDRLLVHDAKIASPSVLAERSLVLEAGGFDESLRFCQDYDLWLRLALRSPVWAVPAFLTKVRQHQSRTRGRVEVNIAFVQVYTKFAKDHPEPRFRRVCDRQRAFYSSYAADQLMAAGEWRPALAQLRAAWRYRPGYWRSWYVLVKGLGRSWTRKLRRHT